MRPRIDTQFARFSLRIGRSRIERLGVFAEETIPPDQKVIEYTGEKIGNKETNRRAAMRLLTGKSTRVYTIKLNRRWNIDGEVGGSGAQFINHSCDPNLTVHKTRRHIFLFSRKRIPRGGELTVDYGFHCDACHCGARTCRGTICSGCGSKSRNR